MEVQSIVTVALIDWVGSADSLFSLVPVHQLVHQLVTYTLIVPGGTDTAVPQAAASPDAIASATGLAATMQPFNMNQTVQSGALVEFEVLYDLQQGSWAKEALRYSLELFRGTVDVLWL